MLAASGKYALPSNSSRRSCCGHVARPTHAGWELDEHTRGYFQDAGRRFELLRKLLAELGGILLLRVTTSRQHDVRGQFERQVASDLAEASELAVSSPPAPCAHLHGHLDHAARHLHTAYEELLGSGLGKRDISTPQAALSAALIHLDHASGLLPGADLVDRASACCDVAVSIGG